MQELTQEQQATNYNTFRHIERVRNLINHVVTKLLTRGENHDQSKLEQPEVDLFTEYTPKLSKVTYGSLEYNEFIKELKPALDHHYARNSHHPEHFKNGLNDMNLLDLLEMFCDWKASSERHNDGNIRKSIEINGKRFNMSDQLVRIFENSVEIFE
jgi:hypothetical protein